VRTGWLIGLGAILFLVLWAALPEPARAIQPEARPRKIVLIAGAITGHGRGTHEYEKNVVLLKHLLDTSPNCKALRTEVHFKGWPENERTLDDADTIVLISDGSDLKEQNHPLFVGNRMQVLEKQMQRGCGLVLFHWSTFAPARFHDQITEWAGGYFDYETGAAANRWYSAIQTWTGPTQLGAPAHPVSRGVKPFTLEEEFYYRLRFREGDPRIRPILLTRPPNETQDFPVAWAVERQNGGRSFGFTGGHFYKNWALPDYRKLILNAVVWTAGAEVPEGGVASRWEPPLRALIVTGHHHPEHDWRKTTGALLLALEQDPRVEVDVTENVEDLATPKIADYDLLVLNYNNWDRPGLSEAAKTNFTRYLASGGGLALIHFANGAFNYTLPNRSSDWKEFRTRIARRAWMHDGPSGHDPYGPFSVSVTGARHPITAGLAPFDTVDELYFRQGGDAPITPLVTARSKVTGRDEPLAWAYDYGKGRVFQTLLGHDEASIRHAAALIRRGAVWAARREPLGFDPPTALLENALFRSGSPWTPQKSAAQSGKAALRGAASARRWTPPHEERRLLHRLRPARRPGEVTSSAPVGRRSRKNARRARTFTRLC